MSRRGFPEAFHNRCHRHSALGILTPTEYELRINQAEPRSSYLYCPDGSHMAMYDDQVAYFTGLIGFRHDIASHGPV